MSNRLTNIVTEDELVAFVASIGGDVSIPGKVGLTPDQKKQVMDWKMAKIKARMANMSQDEIVVEATKAIGLKPGTLRQDVDYAHILDKVLFGCSRVPQLNSKIHNNIPIFAAMIGLDHALPDFSQMANLMAERMAAVVDGASTGLTHTQADCKKAIWFVFRALVRAGLMSNLITFLQERDWLGALETRAAFEVSVEANSSLEAEALSAEYRKH